MWNNITLTGMISSSDLFYAIILFYFILLCSILSHSILGHRGGEGLWRWWGHNNPLTTRPFEGEFLLTQPAAALGEPSLVSPLGPGALGNSDYTLFTQHPLWLLEGAQNFQDPQAFL